MNKIIPNTLTNFQRYLLVFVATLLVLLTSCTVKGSIKTLAGIPAKLERSTQKGHQNFSVNTLEKCASFEALDTQISQKTSFNTNDLVPVILFAATFIFLLGFRPISKQNKHPRYSSSGKIRNAVPLFLEYQKLIIHYSH